MTSPLKIAILSRSRKLYSTSRLARAATLRGHDVSVIDYAKCYCTVGGDQKVHLGNETLATFDAIVPRIAASITSHGAAIVRQFETMGVFTTTGSIALTRSRDKLRSLQALVKHGVSVPQTAFARHPRQADSIIDRLGGPPLVIKLQEGTQGMGVVLADTRSAARSVIQAFTKIKANIIVQEFIAEAKGADIRAFVIGGEVVAAMRRQGAEGDFRSNLHRGGTATSVTLSKRERTAAINAAEALGLSVAGVDMVQSEKGPKILEVNSSPGLEGIEEATGVDIADLMIQFIEQHAPKRRKTDKVGV